jgi:hypothetical protein
MSRITKLVPATLLTLLVGAACSDSKDDAPRPSPASPDGGDPCGLPASLDAIVTVYGSAWNESDEGARLCSLESSLTPSVTYIDPTIDTASREALSGAIGEFLTMATGSSIVQTSGLDARDGELRFAWEFRTNGATVIKGYDYMELDGDGRISSIRGYWDPLPAAPAEGTLAAYQTALVATDAAARRDALEEAATDSVRFTGPDSAGAASGLDDVTDAIALPDGASVTITGTQVYPRFARTEFELSGATTTRVTDYLHLDGDGKITRIARFEGGFPAL